MIPIALRLKNFRSFKQTQEFLFPRGPGLYFLKGDNQVEPELEASVGRGAAARALNHDRVLLAACGLRRQERLPAHRRAGRSVVDN